MSGDHEDSTLKSLGIEGTQSTVDSTVERFVPYAGHSDSGRLNVACSQQQDEETLAMQQPNIEWNDSQALVPDSTQSVPTTDIAENLNALLAYPVPHMVLLNPAGDQKIQQPTTWLNNGAHQQYGRQYPVFSLPSFSGGYLTATGEAVQYSPQFWSPYSQPQYQPPQVQPYPTLAHKCPASDADHTCAGQNARKSEEYKHSCPECGKRFRRPGAVGTHMRCHTGEKPFQCPIPTCRRHHNWFSVKSNMVRHCRKVHASQEEFPILRGVHINKSSQDKR